MQANDKKAVPEEGVFIGECYLPWKQTLEKPSEWEETRAALADPFGKCPEKVKGMVKFFAKWIPAGSEKSKYDKNGNKVEQPTENLA